VFSALHMMYTGVLIIKLNRPNKKNALNQAMYGEITRILDIAGSTDRVITVMLTGEGTCGYFCAGTGSKLC
jgi:enoyl-CoA hydratase/carnithine racemase